MKTYWPRSKAEGEELVPSPDAGPETSPLCPLPAEEKLPGAGDQRRGTGGWGKLSREY